MIDEIITRLQTGSVGNVVRFGTRDLPSPPYICVKTEKHPVGRGIRIIGHAAVDQQSMLEDYIFNESSVLLKDYKFTDALGNYCVVRDADDYTDVVADNDDDTISMERLFYVPNRLH